MWSLHMSNPEEDEENNRKRNTDAHDRLFKVKPLYTELVAGCMANYQPYQNIKACISIKQYMKDKPTKWGYKLFVYTGKTQSRNPTRGLSYSSVIDLLPLSTLGTGYRLYVANVYTSPALFSDLYDKKIGCCGTIRANRIGFPKTQANNLPEHAQRGDMRWIRNGKLLFVNWMDTRKDVFNDPQGLQ